MVQHGIVLVHVALLALDRVVLEFPSLLHKRRRDDVPSRGKDTKHVARYETGEGGGEDDPRLGGLLGGSHGGVAGQREQFGYGECGLTMSGRQIGENYPAGG